MVEKGSLDNILCFDILSLADNLEVWYGGEEVIRYWFGGGDGFLRKNPVF
jgi:hypothetical protein